MTLPTTLRASSKRSEMPVPLRKRSLRRLKPMGNRELPTAPERPRENRRERAARRPPDTAERPPDAALGDVSRPPDTIEAPAALLAVSTGPAGRSSEPTCCPVRTQSRRSGGPRGSGCHANPRRCILATARRNLSNLGRGAVAQGRKTDSLSSAGGWRDRFHGSGLRH
jgi:hypothetical protein